jgi:hypothetical protein
MKTSTIRTLLVICVVLDIALMGLVVYDYYANDQDWIVGVLAAFAVFVLITAILFALAGRKDSVRVAERVAEGSAEEPRQDLVFRQVRTIPPAPIAALREAPPRHIPAPARPVSSGIPFVYNGYTLYHKVVQLKNEGGKRTIYFFAKKKPKSGSMCAKPTGYHVGVNERTGLPFLKRGTGKDGEDLTPAAAAPTYRPQCSALTADGKQCRNSARGGSKYCGSHVGYQPKTLKGSAKKIEGKTWSATDKLTDKQSVKRADTKARVKKAPDTRPSVRRRFLGRRKASA